MARDRPRGAPVGASLAHIHPARTGDRVRFRDAFDRWHEGHAVSGAQWGHDFAVIWVAGPGWDEARPWPVDDVERLDA